MIESKRDKQIELRDKEDMALKELRRRENNLVSTQGGLQANRRVSLLKITRADHRTTSGM